VVHPTYAPSFQVGITRTQLIIRSIHAALPIFNRSWIRKLMNRPGPRFADQYIIDWTPFWPTTFIQHKDMDDLVTAVREIQKSIGDRKSTRLNSSHVSCSHDVY